MTNNEDRFLKISTPVFKVWTIYALYVSFASVILIPAAVVLSVVTEVVVPLATSEQVRSK